MLARLAGIHNLCLMVSPSLGVPNTDHGATFGVCVGVRTVAHHGDRESDDGFPFVAGDAAGAEGGGVVGHVAGVGGGEG